MRIALCRAWLFAALLSGLGVGVPAIAAPAPDSGLSTAEWKAIKGVIGAQVAALKQEDGVRAFAFATPSLQLQFENADHFMRMVHAGYQALIDARYTEFLDGAVVDGQVVQPLRLVLPDNTVLVALYQMQKDHDGRWRIAGCLLAPSTVRAA